METERRVDKNFVVQYIVLGILVISIKRSFFPTNKWCYVKRDTELNKMVNRN